jgi:hypothetical protein
VGRLALPSLRSRQALRTHGKEATMIWQLKRFAGWLIGWAISIVLIPVLILALQVFDIIDARAQARARREASR